MINFYILPRGYLVGPKKQIPLGVLYLCAALKERYGDKVALVDLSVSDIESVLDNDATVHMFSITSLEIGLLNKAAKLLKGKCCDNSVIVGGPGVLAKEMIDMANIDCVCYGHADEEICDIVEGVINGELEKLHVCNPISDIDRLPIPARDMVDGALGGGIFSYDHEYKDGGSTNIISSRGCPYTCAFCSSPSWTRKVMMRDPKLIRKEMEHVIETYGVRQFRFSDDMFTLSDSRIKAVCDEISGLDAVYRISCRVKPMTEYMLQRLRESGCVELSFGVESFDDNVLSTLNKKTTAEDNVNAIRLAKEYGFTVRVLFMVNTPGQTEDTIKMNMEALEGLEYDILACSIFAPLPGTDVWARPEKYGIRIVNRNMDDYNIYSFDGNGLREHIRLFEYIDQDTDKMEEVSYGFRRWLSECGRINKG